MTITASFGVAHIAASNENTLKAAIKRANILLDPLLLRTMILPC